MSSMKPNGTGPLTDMGRLSAAPPGPPLSHRLGLGGLQHHDRLLTLDHLGAQRVVAQIGGFGSDRRQAINPLGISGGRGVHDLHCAAEVCHHRSNSDALSQAEPRESGRNQVRTRRALGATRCALDGP